MSLLPAIFLFLLGLIGGSFLNCVIWRLKNKESIAAKHSICPRCRHELQARDLFPVLSFIWLRGRCRYCREKISLEYPAVELATGLLFAICYLLFGWNWRLAVDLVFVLFLIVIFVYDLKYYLILDVVTVPAMAVALVANLLLGCSFFNLILAGVIGGGFFLLQFLISRGRWIGGGDIRLGFLLGLMLGFPEILVALMLAYLSGSFVGVILILLKKKKLDSAVPFGVFLALGAVLAMFF